MYSLDQSEKIKQNMDTKTKTKLSNGYAQNALQFSLINTLIYKKSEGKFVGKERDSLIDISLVDSDTPRDNLDHKESYVTH